MPDPSWVRAHVDAIRGSRATVSVGHVAPARETWALSTFLAYENVRDRWVFSASSWQHLFGRPKNMAIARHRFLSHGPFAEVIRGGDSKLVQRVAREVAVEEIDYAPAAVVRQVAVRGLAGLFRDRFIHARALRVHRSAHAAPIGLGDRVGIFRRTLSERGFGPVRGATLLVLLAAGIVAFRMGGASARLVRREFQV